MPAMPYAVASLPRKPLQSPYTDDRQHHSNQDASHRRSSHQDKWSSHNGDSYNDDRRSGYSRSSYRINGGSSSSHNSTSSGFHTSASQPSPSSSTTSTASSLRTPPDLLLHGASSLTMPLKGMSTLDGKTKADLAQNQPVHLSVHQLERRLELLSQLSKISISSDLPTPPSSPKLQKNSLPESKKRKADYTSSDKSEDDTQKANKKRQSVNIPKESALVSLSSSRILPISEQWTLPSHKDWTKESYFETAVAYRQRGRELKHRGDHRRRDLSSNKRLASSPDKESLVATLEQMDALLLYSYGFWCEDQAGGGSCVIANWTSLYGLLKYVYDQMTKSKLTVLAGLCRLLEAVVRRHVANHEMRLVNHRLSRTVASTSGGNNAQSPASTTAPSPASSDSTQQALMEASEAMAKIVADNERSLRLLQQAKQTVLNLSVLRDNFPQVANLCEGISKNREWSSLDQATLATLIDPSGGLQDAKTIETACLHNGWAWPIDLSTPFPLLACFGRAILREAAQEAKVHFIMEPVRLP